MRLLLGGVIAVAAALRLWGLDRNPLWSDELFTWFIGSLPTVDRVIQEGVKPDVHPPGYFLLLHFVIEYFGDAETVLRLPSAIASIAAVWVTYLLGAKLYSRKEGLAAAAVMAVSWPGIFLGQDARPYALLLLAVSVATYFWIDLLRALAAQERPRPPIIVGYLLAAFCASYLHYFGLQVVFLQGVGTALLLVRKPRSLALWAGIYGVLALAYVPWLPAMLDQMTGHDNFWIKEREFLSSIRWQLFFAFHLPLWQLALLIAPALLLGLYAGTRSMRGMPRRELLLSSDALVLAWCVAPFLAAFIQSTVSTPVMTSRNLIVILPALYLLLARGICAMPYRAVPALWCGAVLLSQSYQIKDYLLEISKDRFDLAASYVLAQPQSSAFPIVAYTERKSFFDYYFEKLGSPRRVGLLAGTPADIGKIKKFVATSEGFWFLSGPVPARAKFRSYLDATYVLVKSAAFNGTTARLYRLKRKLPPG